MNQPWALSTALYFDSIRSTMWRAEALRIGQSIAAKLGLAITHVDVSGSTKSVHGISTERYLQWGGSSLRRFEQAIHKGPPLTGFGLFWCPDGEDPEVSAFCFTIDYSDDEAKSPRGRAYFHISGDRLAPWMDSLNERLYMVLKDWDALASIKYGYVQPIAIHKVPPLFAYGLRVETGTLVWSLRTTRCG